MAWSGLTELLQLTARRALQQHRMAWQTTQTKALSTLCGNSCGSLAFEVGTRRGTLPVNHSSSKSSKTVIQSYCTNSSHTRVLTLTTQLAQTKTCHSPRRFRILSESLHRRLIISPLLMDASFPSRMRLGISSMLQQNETINPKRGQVTYSPKYPCTLPVYL